MNNPVMNDERSEEDNSDSNSNMAESYYTETQQEQIYNFVSADDEEETEQTEVDNSWNWEFGDHSSMSTVDQNELDAAIDGTMDRLDDTVDEDIVNVLKDAQRLVQSTDVVEFECSHEDCGLGHSHPDWKHDIRASTNASEIRSMIPGFKIDEDFADEMEFVPNCHCGANEAAMLVKFFPYFTQPMFKDQHEFEGVLEMNPDDLDAVYRIYNEEDVSVTRACAQAASRQGKPEIDLAPLGLREDLKLFLERRQQVEQQANKAPIGEETRNAIEENRESLEEMVSQ